MGKHYSSVNCIDFKESEQIWASCSDDGLICVYHLVANKQECILSPNKSINYNNYQNFDMKDKEKIVKIIFCKFLHQTDILVSSDSSGNLNLWCVTTSMHPKKN